MIAALIILSLFGMICQGAENMINAEIDGIHDELDSQAFDCCDITKL